MNIILTPELEKLIQEKINSGRYLSASEVIQEGLRLLDEKERMVEDRLTELKKKLQVAMEEIEQGKVIDGETVFAELEVDIQEKEAQIKANQLT